MLEARWGRIALLAGVTIGAAACGRERPAADPEKEAESERAPALTEAVSVTPAGGERAMAAVVRWARSPDGKSLLVTEDWAGVENEPFADAFVLASENTMEAIRVADVWDAAPSPDWSRLAFGAAFRLRGGESEQVPGAVWAEAAGRIGVPADSVRAASFAASGMSTIAGVAQAGMIQLATGERRTWPVPYGWRVRWTENGNRIQLGKGPARADDDDPATGWVTLDPASGALSPADSTDLTTINWIQGPTIDISVTPDTTAEMVFSVDGGSVQRVEGMIVVRGREVGRGIPLAATAAGCYVAALAPDSAAGAYDPKWRLVVYGAGCATEVSSPPAAAR